MSVDSVQETVIIDAGVGNLGNLRRALEHVGARATITDDPEVVASSRRLLLPGVGAFRPPRERLRGELEEALRSAIGGEGEDGGAWLLGICVGFQLLFESSTEYGTTDGLGLLPGAVEKLPSTVALPQIGWNRLELTAIDGAPHPLVAGLEGAHMYFVHSYAARDVPLRNRLATATHGAEFVAVAGGTGAARRVFGTQFHPEKSGAAGLRLLRNFTDMSSDVSSSDVSSSDVSSSDRPVEAA